MHQILSIFTGAGGLDHGFEKTSFYSVRVAVEMQPEFCESLKWNQDNGYLEKASIIEADLTEIHPRDVITDGFYPNGIIGGPPCESFTSMGQMAGRKDPRGKLVFTFLDWVNELRPKFFVLENVPLMSSIEGGKLFEELIKSIDSKTYKVSHQVLNAANYGAATYRSRLFIVGIQGETSFQFPHQTHFPAGSLDTLGGGLPYCTVRDAIGDLPHPTLDDEGPVQAHTMIKHTDEVRNRFANLKQGQRDYIRKRVRLEWDGQSPSLVAGNLNGIRSHIHPSEARELTNRESARIQGFSDDYCFAGNHAAIGKQIANSVPIALGFAIANALHRQLTHPERG